MKTIHRIDFPVQAFILGASLLCIPFQPMFAFAAFYFGLGGWQFMMAILLACGERPHPIQARHQYENLLITVILLALPCLLPFEEANDYAFFYLLCLLFVGGGMAIWNMTIAYRELQHVKSEHEVWDIE